MADTNDETPPPDAAQAEAVDDGADMGADEGADEGRPIGALICRSARPSRRTSRTAFAVAPPEPDDALLGFAPYLHSAPRGNSITPERQREFIAVLAATGIVTQAARRIGVSLEALYRLRGQPGAEGFAAAWQAALDRGVARLEDCALERALQGTATPIVSGGEILGWWGKPDNGLLRFLLQQRLPKRYGARAIEPGHPVWEAVREAVLADPALVAREQGLRDRLTKAEARVSCLEQVEAELVGEVDKLEAELARVEEHKAELQGLIDKYLRDEPG